jgi:tRNA(Ile)-lysidine synthase
MKESDASPVSDSEFASLMAGIGPFETNPALAVACSGGPDSMALAVLLRSWVRGQGGRLTALIVDHGIRKDSGLEAGTVAGWLNDAGIDAVVRRVEGLRGKGDLQAEARKARYAVMADWCARHECLHLVVAHHVEDQAETLLLRLARGSGVDGLSGMAPVVEAPTYRILRPLLQVSRARIMATLTVRNASHVTDPSNQSDAFARVRFRKLADRLAQEGMTSWRLAATAAHLSRAREALDRATASLLARSFVLHEAGYGYLQGHDLMKAPRETGLRALAAILSCIGAAAYPPRFERLERLYDALGDLGNGGGRTLGGCRILARRQGLLICRESAAIDERVAARGEVFWDSRFRMTFPADTSGTVGRLGRDGWLTISAQVPALKATQIPAAVRPSLPAVWRNRQIVSVPHLGYVARDLGAGGDSPEKIHFAPLRPLVSPRFTLH